MVTNIKSRLDHKKSVIQEVEEVVGEFASFMTLFSKLSSPLFQLEHWEKFFRDIGHDFVDPFDTLTVGDLIKLDIRQFSSIIETLFSNATLRNKAFAEFENHLRFWMTREFDFLYHVPDTWFRNQRNQMITQFQRSSTQQSVEKSSAEIFYDKKKLDEKLERLERLPITNNQGRDIYLVSEFKRLYDDMTDSIITLRCRYNTNVKENAEPDQFGILLSALEELQRLCDILQRCQEKWLFLEMIFGEEYFVRSYHELALTFKDVNEELISVSVMLRLHPNAIQHSGSGQRFLAVKSSNQNHVKLVDQLKDLNNTLDTIISSLDTVLNNARIVFPRLYFLTDEEVLKVISLSISKNVKSITPFIFLCFDSVKAVFFEESASGDTLSIISSSGEKVHFIKELTFVTTATQWLKEFELILKSTVKCYILSCLVQQLGQGSKDDQKDSGSQFFVTERPNSSVFDEIDQIENLVNRIPKEKKMLVGELMNDILKHYQAWLLRYPLQTVLLVEKILFFKSIKDLISKKSSSLKELREKLYQKESSFVKLKNVLKYETESRIAVEYLILENRNHLDIIEKLSEDQHLSLNSFNYRRLIKYNVDFDESKMWKTPSVDICGDVNIEVLCSKYLFDYEYVDIRSYNLMNPSVTDRSLVNMMIALDNYEIGSLVGAARSSKETFTQVSQILGRNMFSVCCSDSMSSSLITRYMKGAMLSGTVLHLDNFDKLRCNVISALSIDIWHIRKELENISQFHIFPKKIRQFSASSKSTNIEYDEIFEISPRSLPNSDRTGPQRHITNSSQMNLYDIYDSKLYQRKTCLSDEVVHTYSPRLLTRINLYSSLLDVRYGFGILSTIDENFALQKIPLTMKSQMRVHSLIPIEVTFLLKKSLILADFERTEELEKCINIFFKNISNYLPEIVQFVKELLPKVLLNLNGSKTKNVIEFGTCLYDLIEQRFSPNSDCKGILKEAIQNSFNIDYIENDYISEDSPALVHQLKCELRLRALKVSKGFINKMVMLKHSINNNKITILNGDACSGKSTSLDVLSAAINGLYSSVQRTLSGSKKRGTIEVLKAISQERKFQVQDEENNTTIGKRVQLIKLSLSNFTSEELSTVMKTEKTERLGALMTIVNPWLKFVTAEKFEIWIYVDQTLNKKSEFIYPLKRIFENETSVKIIIEENSSPTLMLKLNPDLEGLVNFEYFPNLWKILLKNTAKRLLSLKIISYYGCKLLIDVGENMFQNFFESISLQLKCSKDEGLWINFLKQTLVVLEIIFLEYAKYNPSESEDNLLKIEKKYKCLLCFSIIQGSRGTLYSVLIGQRLLTLEEFEEKLLTVLRGNCEIILKKDDFEVGLFGVMIDFNSLTMKPFEDVNGCKLRELWSNSDGVGNRMLHLFVKHQQSVQFNGAKSKVEAFLETVRFNKRIHLNKNTSIKKLRKCLHDKAETYWKIISNEDPLGTKSKDKDVIVIERFDGYQENSSCINSFLHFVLENKYCFDGESFSKFSTKEAVIILTDYSREERKWENYSKLMRCVIEINIVEPSFSECRYIINKSLSRWFQKVENHKAGLSKLVSKHLGDFLVDIAISLHQYRAQLILEGTFNDHFRLNITESVNQVTWSQLCKVVCSLTIIPIDMLQNTIKNLEKSFPLEKSDNLKKYKRFSIYIRIIRHSIFGISREFVDRTQRKEEIKKINSFIQESIQKNLLQTISTEIDEMILKHFPIPVENLTDIVLWPCRIIDAKSYEKNSELNYQPTVEAHCWDMINLAQENICNFESVKNHLHRNPQLFTVSKNYDFLNNLMKIYKHVSSNNCKKSSLFIQYTSSLISGKDYGVFLSGLITAKYVRPEDLLDCTLELIQSSMKKAGKINQKVLLHIDSNCLEITDEIYEMLTQLLNQDSLTPFLQYLQLPFLHKAVREFHSDFYIPTDSPKEIRLSKAFLENIRRNLKILVTCDTHDWKNKRNLQNLSLFFQETDLNYIMLEEYCKDVTEESLNFMTKHSSSYISSTLSKIHSFLIQQFQNLANEFGSHLMLSGKHLQLGAALYNYLYQIFLTYIKKEMGFINSAIESVNYAKKELDVLKDLKSSFQEDLRKLNDEVEISGNEGKNMRDNYATALIQCKNQENKVGELFGPLNEMKEKSQTNFEEVSPTYLAALETIRNLDPDAIEEIKTYVKPPQQVRDLVAAIFDLLGYETKWELIKERMVKINLYEELLYLNKDHISDDKFKNLEKKLLDPSLHTEYLESISQAAASLSKWLTAIYKYSSLNKEINPQLGQLLTCQDQINRAQSELGKMRVRADIMRQDLERKILEHKDLLSKRKNVADKLKNINYKINSGTNLMSDLLSHYNIWKKEEAVLEEEMKNLPKDVLKTVIRSVYLDRFPYSLRISLAEDLQAFGLDFMEKENIGILQEEDYRDILGENIYSSLQRSRLLTTAEIVSITSCPDISYPDLGSMIMIHCYSEMYDQVVKTLSFVLESEIFKERFEDFGNKSNIRHIDCGRCDLHEIDEALRLSLQEGDVLLLGNVQLLPELTCGLLELIKVEDYNTGSGQLVVNPRFRLIFICNDGYSYNGFLQSQRFLHFNFLTGKKDFENDLESTLVRICEPDLYQGALNCKMQMLELRKSCSDSKKIITNIASSCIKSDQIKTSKKADKLSPISEKTSLLDVENFHSTLLEIDSKLLTLDESRDAVKEKEKEINRKLEKYKNIIENLSLLLYHFNIFRLDKIMDTNEQRYKQGKTSRNALKDVIVLIKEVGIESTKSIIMSQCSDPEITEMFLKKLQISIMVKLISLFYVRMDSLDTFHCVLEFCVDKMILDSQDVSSLSPSERKFLKTTLLCCDTEELLEDVDTKLEEFNNLQTNNSVSKGVLKLSWILETKISVLKGLTQSVLNDRQLWDEYFQFPYLESNSTPGFDIIHQPEVLLKAMIWRVLNPEKADEVKQSLIASVFGEDIFQTKISRILQCESIVSDSNPVQPIIVSTLKHTMSGIQSPLELIDNVRMQKKYFVNLIIIDCSSPAEVTNLITLISNKGSLYADHLSTKPSWIVLSNFHLFTSDYFNCKHFRIIKRTIERTSLKSVHSDSRFFITLEIDSLVEFPESFLSVGKAYHCSPDINYSVEAEKGKLCNKKKNDCENLLSLIYSRVFNNSSFMYNSTPTTTDYKVAWKICSKRKGETKDVVRVVDFLCRNKICQDSLRKVFDLSLSEISRLLKQYDDGDITSVALKRNFHERLQGDLWLYIKKPVSDKVFGRKESSLCNLRDSETIEFIKNNFIKIIETLSWIFEQPIEPQDNEVYQYSVRVAASALLEKVFSLGIWRHFSVSSSGSRGFNIELVQNSLCKNIIPKDWRAEGEDNTLLQWLNELRYVADNFKEAILNPDFYDILGSLETMKSSLLSLS